MIGFDFMSHHASYSVPIFSMWDSSSQYNTIFHFTFTISQEAGPVTCMEFGLKLTNLFLYLGRILHGSDLFFTFVTSTLSHYGLLKLSLFSIRRWAEPSETFFFCSYVGRARSFRGLQFFLISTTSKFITN